MIASFAKVAAVRELHLPLRRVTHHADRVATRGDNADLRRSSAMPRSLERADGEQIVRVYGQAWTKPKTGPIDLGATVQGIAATLTRYGGQARLRRPVDRSVDCGGV